MRRDARSRGGGNELWLTDRMYLKVFTYLRPAEEIARGVAGVSRRWARIAGCEPALWRQLYHSAGFDNVGAVGLAITWEPSDWRQRYIDAWKEMKTCRFAAITDAMTRDAEKGMNAKDGHVSGHDLVAGVPHHCRVKCCLVGDAEGGKTMFYERFIKNDAFNSENYHYFSTIGIDYRYKTVGFKNKIVKLMIWDTPGCERFRDITASFYRGSHLVLLMVNVSDALGWQRNTRNWLQLIRRHASEGVQIVIVGTKCDLRTGGTALTIPREELEAFAADEDLRYVETSAKTGEGVERAVVAAIYALWTHLGRALWDEANWWRTRTEAIPCGEEEEPPPITGNNNSHRCCVS